MPAWRTHLPGYIAFVVFVAFVLLLSVETNGPAWRHRAEDPLQGTLRLGGHTVVFQNLERTRLVWIVVEVRAGRQGRTYSAQREVLEAGAWLRIPFREFRGQNGETLAQAEGPPTEVAIHTDLPRAGFAWKGQWEAPSADSGKGAR